MMMTTCSITLERGGALDPKLIKPFVAVQPGAGTISGAVFDAPRIMVEADTKEALSGVLYLMCFKAGKFVVRYSTCKS